MSDALVGGPRTRLAIAGVAVFWFRSEITTLKATISAQGDAIKGLEAAARASQTLAEAATKVLETTDAPRMLERYKAYQEIVDHEKEVAVRQRTAQHEATLNLVLAHMDQIYDLMAAFLPFVPKARRMQIIDGSQLPETAKDSLRRLSDAAPDLSWGAVTAAFEEIAGTFAKGLVNLSDLKPPEAR